MSHGKFDPRAVLAKLRAGTETPPQASPGPPPSGPPPQSAPVIRRGQASSQPAPRAQASAQPMGSTSVPADHQKNELLQLVHAKKQLPGGTSVDVERYLKTLEERLRGVERELGQERAKYSQLLQEHERVEALRVSKEKEDANKIKDLQAQVANLKGKLLEQQEAAQRNRPFDESIVFRSEVASDDAGDLRIAWEEVQESDAPASPDEILLRRSATADNHRAPASEPRSRRSTRTGRPPMNALSPRTSSVIAAAPASVSIDLSSGPVRQRRSQSLRPSSSSKSRLYAKTFSAEMRQKADPDSNITVQDLDAYLRKPAKDTDENAKPAFVSSSSAGRSHRFGAAGRRGSVSIQIPDAGEQEPPAININFSDLG